MIEASTELSWSDVEAEDCAQRPIRPSDLLSLREIGGVSGSGLSVSPDGRYMAFEAHQANVAANSYRVGWFVTETSGPTMAINVGDGGEATQFRSKHPDGRVVGAWISTYARWAPDSNGLAYLKTVGRATQIWWSSRRGGAATQLTHNAADVTDFYWSHDGSRLYFATGAARADLHRMRESRYRSGHIFEYEQNWSTDDAQPYYPPYELTGGEPRIWILDRVSGQERLATSEESQVFYDLKVPDAAIAHGPGKRHVITSSDARGVAWLQPDDREKQGIDPPMTLYASLDGSRPIRCPAKECAGAFDADTVLRAGLHWKSVDDEIVFVRKESTGYSKRTVYTWKPGAERVRRVLSTDDWVSDCSIVGNRAICFRETPTQPRVIVSLDIRSGSIETLVDPNPQFRCLETGRVELMKWTNSHGYETFGYLVTPPDMQPEKRYPLVFVGYRARFALRGGVGDEYPVHLLANRGFVVLVYEKPSVYAALETYSDPIDIGRARWGPDLFDVTMPLASFEAAIDILSKRGLIDPSRVAVTGLSNGVAHVNYALIHSNLFAAAIVSSCEFAPSARVLSGAAGSMIRDYRRAIGAGPYPGPYGFIYPELSLSLNASRINTPLLINVSDDEHSWALEEVVALIEAGKPVEMVVYPDEGHVKWHPTHRASIYESNIAWLKFWLTDMEGDDQGLSERYARWHRLRAHWQTSAPRTSTEGVARD